MWSDGDELCQVIMMMVYRIVKPEMDEMHWNFFSLSVLCVYSGLHKGASKLR